MSTQRKAGGVQAIGDTMNNLAQRTMLVVALSGVPLAVHAQAPEGPMTPQPGAVIQKAPPKIRVRTLLVNTPVTVRDTSGEMVHNLEESDFRVTDNGEPQKITHFNLGGDPISLVVVVETSSRIGPILPQIRKMGILISQTVTGPTGEGAVVGFNDEVKTLLDFTNSADAMEKTMSRLKEETAGSKLFDAMSKAVEMLSARPEVSDTDLGHRRVMLVLGEAHDSGSEEKLGEVLRRAQLANITIYAVGVSGAKADLQKKPDYKKPPSATPEGTFGMPPPPGTVQTPTTQEQAEEAGSPLAAAQRLAVWAVSHAKDKVTAHQLEIAAAATGGQHVSTWKNRTIEKVIDEMGGELHSQYTLTYTPSGDMANGYHEIQVTIDRPELSVRARPGYYLAGPEE
ncbi:MAG: VWA domain-containing protein [Candidatus Acidiferrum sp.]